MATPALQSNPTSGNVEVLLKGTTTTAQVAKPSAGSFAVGGATVTTTIPYSDGLFLIAGTIDSADDEFTVLPHFGYQQNPSSPYGMFMTYLIDYIIRRDTTTGYAYIDFNIVNADPLNVVTAQTIRYILLRNTT